MSATQPDERADQPADRARIETALEAYIRLLSALTDYTPTTGLYLPVLAVFCDLPPDERVVLDKLAARCFQAREVLASASVSATR